MHIHDVVELAQQNSRAAYSYIVRKYRGIIHGRIKKGGYFLQGGDYEDLFQEGLIGLYKAIRDFQKDNGAFDVFSKICIDRQLISAIKTSTRKKHTPLNDMISLDRTLPENDNLNMMDIFGARDDVRYSVDFDSLSPEEQLILKETYTVQKKMLEESLSSKEKIIYDLYLEHKSYKEIMDDLGVENPKMIDNAIQRVKRKIERIKEIDWSNINTKNN
jgi:RNA polymerase sporulation-specific sigma factor